MSKYSVFPVKRCSVYIFIGIMLTCSIAFIHNGSLQVKAEEEQPRYGGRLVLVTSEPGTLFTPIETSHPAFFASSYAFASLLQFDLDMVPHPWLAESWEISSDGLTYTFNLVKNATWHDGEPVTSADVKFTIENVTIPYHPRAGKWAGPIDTVETPDDYTVVFKLKEPSAVFLYGMDAKFFAIAPKHLYEGTDILKNEYNWKPVGCGPFKFKEYLRGDHVTFVRDEDYFREGLPYLDSVVIKISAEETLWTMMIQSGEIDYIPVWTNPADVATLQADPKFDWAPEMFGVTSMRLVFLNQREDRLTSDINVRRAIAHAINKSAHVEKVVFGLGTVSHTPFPPSIKWCYKAEPEYIYEYNVTKANEILDNAGYPRGPDGFRFKLEGRSGVWMSEQNKNLEMLKQELEEIGIDLSIQFMERSVLNEEVFAKHNFDLFQQGYETGPDPVIGMYRYILTDQITHTPFKNVELYSNTRVDELAELAAVELDREKRKEYYYEMQDIISGDLPFVVTYEVQWISIWNKDFKGLPCGPYGLADPIDRVWWTKGELPPSGIPEIFIYAAVAIIAIVVVSGLYLYTRRKRKA